MIRAPFQIHKPSSVKAAVRLLSRYIQNGADVKLLAGGQSLLPSMNLGLVAPAHIVSLNHIPGLDSIRRDGESLVIGAGATHRALAASAVVQAHCPILSETAAGIGDVQVRNRGTLGGSIGHCDPAADYPPVLVLLDAACQIVGPSGERTVPATDVFVDYMTTSLNADEVLTAIRVPVLPPDTGTAYLKFTRVEGGFALVGVGVCLGLHPDRTCRFIRVGICGAASVPVRVSAIEETLTGRLVDDTFIAAVAEAAYEAAHDPVAELHAEADYKREMVRVFTRRAVRTALERTQIQGSIPSPLEGEG